VTEFPSDQPAEHPTGFPVESEPDARPDPETEPGGGEPDFDSEPDRTATPESATPDPSDDPTPSDDSSDVSTDGADEVAGESARGDVDEGERGHPLVEETMERLDDLRGRPVSEHGEVYADLQERLQSALVEADRPDASERV
jgi:hypothetical protein